MKPQQIKAKVFSLYLYQEVMMHPEWGKKNELLPSYLEPFHIQGKSYLSLRSVKGLTDEELDVISKLYMGFSALFGPWLRDLITMVI